MHHFICVVGTYGREFLDFLLSERVRFRRLAHTQLVKCFSDLRSDVPERVVAILTKVKPFATMARFLPFKDGVVKDNVEIGNYRSRSHE